MTDNGLAALAADEEESIRAEFPRWGVTDYENRAFHRLLATLDAERATIATLRAALEYIRDELGVPDENYPAPVSNAADKARAALATAKDVTK
jgi:hypothetical protein